MRRKNSLLKEWKRMPVQRMNNECSLDEVPVGIGYSIVYMEIPRFDIIPF